MKRANFRTFQVRNTLEKKRGKNLSRLGQRDENVSFREGRGRLLAAVPHGIFFLFGYFRNCCLLSFLETEYFLLLFWFFFLFYNENRLLMLRAIGCSYSYLISFLFVGKKKNLWNEFSWSDLEREFFFFFFPPDPPRLSIRTGPTAAPSEAPHLHRQTVCFVSELFWTFLFCPFLYTPTVGRLYVYGVFIVSMCWFDRLDGFYWNRSQFLESAPTVLIHYGLNIYRI